MNRVPGKPVRRVILLGGKPFALGPRPDSGGELAH